MLGCPNHTTGLFHKVDHMITTYGIDPYLFIVFITSISTNDSPFLFEPQSTAQSLLASAIPSHLRHEGECHLKLSCVNLLYFLVL
jgi:hypothetical protein